MWWGQSSKERLPMEKKIIRLTVALLVALTVLAVYLTLRPSLLARYTDLPVDTNTDTTTESTGTADAQKTAFTVAVVQKDGTAKDFTLRTEQTTLGAALLESDLVEAEANRFGLQIKAVNGVKAAYDENNAYWAVFSGEQAADRDPREIPIEEGGSYKLVYIELDTLISSTNGAEHLFYNVFLPIARGYIGDAWDTVQAFAQHMGYTAVADEGVYTIQSATRSDVFFSGELTTAGDSTELADVFYQVHTDGHEPAIAGVKGRYEDTENPENHRENPVYFVDGFAANSSFKTVQTLNEVIQYILDYGTLKIKNFTLIVQDTFGQPQNTYLVVTSEDYMGPALENAGYINLGQDDTGAYIIKRVQGVSPASGCVWQLWKGDSYKDLPVGTTPVEHGATYTIVYKRLK